MTATTYDTIVVGLGAMGSATAFHLARRGESVLAIEQYRPGHSMGSSHGDSRIIREQYFEHPLYVPLVQRAYELWRELEIETRIPLMSIHGGLMIGPRDGEIVSGTIRSATEHHLSHEVLSPRQVRDRFPAFSLPDDTVAVFDPHAGLLDPDACCRAHIQAAVAAGAEVHFDEPVLAWEADGSGVTVRTAQGFHRGRTLVLTAGAWTRELVPGIALPLAVERQVVFWFDVDRSREEYARDHFPIYAFQHEPGGFCYGFPRLLRGAKAAVMHRGEVYASPDDVDRSVGPEEVDALRDALRPILPGLADAPVRESMVCLFTNTPDQHFLIDRHPHHPQVLISSPCSGHGFKFASAIGEAHADLLLDGHCRFDLSPFRLSRFGEAALGS